MKEGGKEGVPRWLPAAGWAALIFTLSSISGSSYPAVAIPFADKIVHVMLYAPLGALFARAMVRPRSRTTMVLAVLGATLYGVTDELHQMFVPMRSPDLRDVLADAIGSIIGAGVFVTILRRRNTRA